LDLASFFKTLKGYHFAASIFEQVFEAPLLLGKMEEVPENATPMNTLHWGKHCHRLRYPEVDANLENPIMETVCVYS
jgi:hypothetical protein